MSVLKHWRALLFDEHAMIGVRQAYRPWHALLWFALAFLFQAAPVSTADIATLPFDAPRIAALFFGVLLVGWLVSLLLGGRQRFGQYAFTTSAITAMGGCVMAVLAYLSIFVFEYGFDTTAVTNVLISIIPFYYIVLVAYGSEMAAHLARQRERIALAICVIITMYAAYFYL